MPEYYRRLNALLFWRISGDVERLRGVDTGGYQELKVMQRKLVHELQVQPKWPWFVVIKSGVLPGQFCPFLYWPSMNQIGTRMLWGVLFNLTKNFIRSIADVQQRESLKPFDDFKNLLQTRMSSALGTKCVVLDDEEFERARKAGRLPVYPPFSNEVATHLCEVLEDAWDAARQELDRPALLTG